MATTFCSHCGFKNEAIVTPKFCGDCGKAIGAASMSTSRARSRQDEPIPTQAPADIGFDGEVGVRGDDGEERVIKNSRQHGNTVKKSQVKFATVEDYRNSGIEVSRPAARPGLDAKSHHTVEEFIGGLKSEAQRGLPGPQSS